ncbi:MAG: hypothetical protein DME43_08225, partial [Verrucomicrobia bacterium]
RFRLSIQALFRRPSGNLSRAALFFLPVKPLCTAIVAAFVVWFIREKSREPLMFASILLTKL